MTDVNIFQNELIKPKMKVCILFLTSAIHKLPSKNSISGLYKMHEIGDIKKSVIYK